MAEVVVFGAGGYSGQELLRWLSWHPHIDVVGASSDTWADARVDEHVPAAAGGDLRFTSHVETLASTQSGQIALLAVPARTAAELVPSLIERGLRVIDVSGAHRLPPELYPEWYGFEHPFPEQLRHAVYGLPEIVPHDQIAGAQLIANPGCYATAAALAAAPLLKAELCAEGGPFVVDGKSGATGAGRSLSTPMLFSEVSDDVRPYKVGRHQHTPEMERTLEMVSSSPVKVLFSAHLVPMRRGLLCSVYVPARSSVSPSELKNAYQSFYDASPLVNVREKEPETKRTLGLAHAEVWSFYDQRTQLLCAYATIDNLVKGAAGQAIQNLNIMLGFEPQLGLRSGSTGRTVTTV